MKAIHFTLALMLLCGLPLAAAADPVQAWQSKPEATDTVELFTSEGCSSCPPADRWLSSLRDRPDLFTGFIPLAFHVDYWDYIGWEDRMARAAYTDRQRDYVASGSVSQVYTPGFVVNGEEWRPWFRGARDWSSKPKAVGVLSTKLAEDRTLKAEFSGYKPGQLLHAAYLGMGLKTRVKAGENRGRELNHDFVVLDVTTSNAEQPWSLALPPKPDAGQQRTALVVWVSDADSPAIIQSVGGYLD